MKVNVPDEFKQSLIKLKRDKNVYLEGNIPKILDDGDNLEFKKYLQECIKSDKEGRKKRLEITKRIQEQNKELIESEEKNKGLMLELKQALESAEEAKDSALSDLELVQKKQQFELIGTIVKIALLVILGVGGVTTAMYVFSLIIGKDTQIIGSTWANMFGILLTNAFSIVGTIMGVKYASEKKDSNE
jgi:hypothetical protein